MVVEGAVGLRLVNVHSSALFQGVTCRFNAVVINDADGTPVSGAHIEVVDRSGSGV